MIDRVIVCLGLGLAGCASTGITASPPTVAACLPVVLQAAQNLHQLQGGLAAVAAEPITVMPAPVVTQPPPVVVMPSPTGPVVLPPPSVPPGGPIVTPNARLQRRAALDAE